MSEAPKTFWDDLTEDLKDPEFREAYVKASREIAEVDDECTGGER